MDINDQIIPDHAQHELSEATGTRVSENPLSKNVEKVFEERIQHIEHTTPEILDQFLRQKKKILKETKGWLGHLVEDIFSKLVSEVETIKNRFQEQPLCKEKENHLPEADINRLQSLYDKASNQRELVSHILSQLASSTQKMIDRDIQVIKEYQQHSLNQKCMDPEIVESMKTKLEEAMAGPLQKLIRLRDRVVPRFLEHDEVVHCHCFCPIRRRIPLKQWIRSPSVIDLKNRILAMLPRREERLLEFLSLWSLKFQHQRQSYFDILLSRIDRITDNLVSLDTGFVTGFVEEEGDLLFIQRELKEIEKMVCDKDHLDDQGKQFFIERLEGIADQLDELASLSLPHSLRRELDKLKTQAFNTTLDLRKAS